jgi:hypothetical protein
MPQLIYDVQFKIDQSSLSGLKNIVDSSTTGEVTKLTEKIEKLESQLNNLKGTNQKVSKSTKQLVDQSKQKTDAVKRDEAILKRALQTNNLNNKSVQEAAVRLQQGTAALEGHTNEMAEASVSTKRSATSQQALAKQVTTTTGTITRATGTLEQFNQQINRSQKGFKGSNKEFSIANQTLFGFGDLAQDATQFSQGFAQGMRAIGNNIAFNAEMFGTLKTRTGSYMGAFKALGASFTGVGGAILAVNVAVMVATSLLTKFSGKAKETVNDLEEFIDATQELTRVSSADFLDINSLEAQRQGLLEIKEVVEDLERQEKLLLSETQRYSSYVESESREALEAFRKQNEGLSKVELKAVEKGLKEVNDKLILKNALLKLSPLAGFRLGLEQSTDILVNNFEAGLIRSSSALEHQRDLIQDYIDRLRKGDVDTLEALGLDKDTPLAPTILYLLELFDKLSDTIPELKPILTLEELGSDIDVFETRMMKLPSGLKDAFGDVFLELGLTDVPTLEIFGEDEILKQQAQERQAALDEIAKQGVDSRVSFIESEIEKSLEGSIFIEEKKLKEAQERVKMATDLAERERLQSLAEMQQKRVDALRKGLGEERTIIDEMFDSFETTTKRTITAIDPEGFLPDFDFQIDVPSIDIIGEDDVLKDQARERERAMTQVMKDGVDARLNEVNREIEGNKRALTETEIAEKGKQAARQLGIQGAQAVSQAIQGLFGESKEIAIAETIISTYFAAQKAFESQMLIATPDAPVRANIAAGVAIVQGLARVAAIRSTNKGGGGGGGRSGGGQRPSASASSSFLRTSGEDRSSRMDRPLFAGESSFLPSASGSGGGAMNVNVINTFNDRTVASVTRSGNEQRRQGAVSGI